MEKFYHINSQNIIIRNTYIFTITMIYIYKNFKDNNCVRQLKPLSLLIFYSILYKKLSSYSVL
jgi:hypothetical protein